MNQSGGFDAEALLLGYSAGELTAPEERALFEAAAQDQFPPRYRQLKHGYFHRSALPT